MIRPSKLSEVVGQEHILSDGKPLKNILDSGTVPNMIFYGPSGTGKTTVANIAAKNSGKKLYRLNATTAGVGDIRSIITELDGILCAEGVRVYV